MKRCADCGKPSPLYRCGECFAVHKRILKGTTMRAPVTPAPDTPLPAPVPPSPPPHYYCRAHPDVPVRWTGRGCPECDTNQRRPRRQPR